MSLDDTVRALVDERVREILAVEFARREGERLLAEDLDVRAGGAFRPQLQDHAADAEIVEGVGQAMKVQTGGLGGSFVWPSLIRKLDRIDDSYKQ